jgi:hypothetical protein
MIETLYKRTAIGLYSIEFSYNKVLNGSKIVSRYGLVFGKKIIHVVDGDAKKFDALVKKKRQEGYKSLSDVGAKEIDELAKLLPVYNSDENNNYKTMKCQPFVADKFAYENGAFGQPKINGNRGTVRWALSDNGMFSTYKPVIKSHEGIILNIKHIEDAFIEVFKHCPKDTVFDGELVAYGELVTTISGACKNPKNPVHKSLIFKCFDLAIPDIDQKTRLEMKHTYLKKAEFPGRCDIQRFVGQYKELSKSTIVDVIDVLVHNDEEASQLRDECIKAGYEGCVIRNPSATYRFGSRPVVMMKLKKPKYGYFEVIDIVPYGDSSADNNVGVGCKFVLRNDLNTLVFESNPIGSVDEKLEYVKNKGKFIGKKVMLKYFERTTNNLPFHHNVLPNPD